MEKRWYGNTTILPFESEVSSIPLNFILNFHRGINPGVMSELDLAAEFRGVEAALQIKVIFQLML